MKDEGFGVWYVSCGGLGMWGRWFVRMWRYEAGVWLGVCVRGGLEVPGGRGCVFVGDWRCVGGGVVVEGS